VKPLLLDEGGKEIHGEGEGYLVFSQPWPGMMRTVFNDQPRFESTYFSKFPGYYCTGDGENSKDSKNFADFELL
jgi:acetyl-CoA synthetase